MSLENAPKDYFDLSKIPGPPKLSKEEEVAYIEEITAKIKSVNATIVAHYYTDAIVQELAENCGGFVGDSLEMAKFGAKTDASTIIVAGVRFMGETAKILSPEKNVYMPTLNATCSLDLGCPIDEFSAFCDEHEGRTVVVYANTSAAVKARSDWVVTSSIAVDVVTHLAAKGEKILWAPDRYLGSYIKEKTGADMEMWNGSCVVHEEFKAKELKEMMQRFPDAGVLVHPESPASVIRLADVVGSTTQLIKAAARLDNRQFIVATDRGIFYKMKKAAPFKTFMEAPTAGEGATCQSCAHCPWMAMNHLPNLRTVLNTLESKDAHTDLSEFEIIVDPDLAEKAMIPLNRMVNFVAKK